MNKKLVLLFLALSTSLTGCKIFNRKSEDSGFFDSPIIFSQFHRGYDTNDRAIEIYNRGDKEVRLGEYFINIYKQNETEPHIRIQLEGFISPGMTQVIAYDQASEEIQSIASLVTYQLMIDGTWPVTLTYHEKLADVLGTVGYQYDYGTNVDLVRKEEFLVGRETFNSYDWIKYDADKIDLLGSIETTISEEELLEGPKLTDEDFSKPFVKDGYGGGGAIEVSLNYPGDGDTTSFSIPAKYQTGDISGTESVRYYGINTPEIQHGTSIDAQPWGEAAKKYNNQVLKGANHFVLQTVLDGSYRETYGRMLAYVWYSNIKNPEPKDYTCLNFQMVREAYAFMYFAKANDNRYNMFYKSVAYINIFENAETRAKQNGWKIHGEVDPNFHY